jgi:hypothetical protein
MPDRIEESLIRSNFNATKSKKLINDDIGNLPDFRDICYLYNTKQ